MAKPMTREQLVEMYMARGMTRHEAEDQLAYENTTGSMLTPEEKEQILAEIAKDSPAG